MIRLTYPPVLLALLIVPVSSLLSGCSRPQPTEEEVAAPLSPPVLGYGSLPPGGVSESPTGGGAGGSAAAGSQYDVGRMGGPMPQPVVSAPSGYQIHVSTGHRMSPTTNDPTEGYSSSGSGGGDSGIDIPPNVSLQYPPSPALAKLLNPAAAASAPPPKKAAPAKKAVPVSSSKPAHKP